MFKEIFGDLLNDLVRNGVRSLLSGDSDDEEAIRAKRFILEDAKGEPRAALITDEDGLPGLIMDDEKGKTRLMLGIGKNGPFVNLLDKKGNGRVLLYVENNSITLCLSDKDDKPRVALCVDKDMAALSLFDKKTKLRVALSIDKDRAALDLSDKEERVRAGLDVDKEGRPDLTLYDDKSEVIWSTTTTSHDVVPTPTDAAKGKRRQGKRGPDALAPCPADHEVIDQRAKK